MSPGSCAGRDRRSISVRQPGWDGWMLIGWGGGMWRTRAGRVAFCSDCAVPLWRECLEGRVLGWISSVFSLLKIQAPEGYQYQSLNATP